MTNNVTSEQSARIDNFVDGLEGRTREIVTAYMRIENTPDCVPELLAINLKFGDDFKRISDLVEELRLKLKVHYDVLQPELRQRLYQ